MEYYLIFGNPSSIACNMNVYAIGQAFFVLHVLCSTDAHFCISRVLQDRDPENCFYSLSKF